MNPMRRPAAMMTLSAVLLLGAPPLGLWAQTSAPAAAATTMPTPEQSAAALAGAHAALLGLAHSKSLLEAMDHLTDRSVGALGIVFTIPVAFVMGFAQMGNAPDKPSPDPDLQKDFTAYLTKYLGDPKSTQALTGLPETLKGHEREYVIGLMGFDTRVKKLSKDSGDDGFKFDHPIPTDFQKYQFAVVSPTEVKITPTKENTLNLPGVVSLSAMLENGQWRLDLGDPAVILKSLNDSAKSTGAPKTNPLADKMIDAVKAHDIPGMKTLLHQDPKLVDAQDFVGESALYNTVFWEDIPTATFLIAHGAKVNAANNMGKTPLDEAIFFKRTQMIALLKKHGAKTGAKKKDASP